MAQSTKRIAKKGEIRSQEPESRDRSIEHRAELRIADLEIIRCDLRPLSSDFSPRVLYIENLSSFLPTQLRPG